VVEQVDAAFKVFFRRVKAGQKPGFPRFKSRNRFHSIEFKQFGSGIRIDGKRLRVFGVGRLAVRWHREMEGLPKMARIKHVAGQWFVCIVCDVPDQPPLPKTGRAIGLDVGVSALITTSDGEKVDHPNFYRASQKRLRVLQRHLARAKPGSRNRKKVLRQVQRPHQRAAVNPDPLNAIRPPRFLQVCSARATSFRSACVSYLMARNSQRCVPEALTGRSPGLNLAALPIEAYPWLIRGDFP
jgi:putative transposase